MSDTVDRHPLLALSRRAATSTGSVARDIAFAVRSLRRAPALAATIVLTLALGIGATTAMFSIVNGVLLAPLPFENADRLVWTVNRGTRPYDAMSQPDFDDWARLNDSFEAVGSYLIAQVGLAGGSTPVHLASAEVTGNWFTMLGVRMTAGRSIVPDDEGPGAPKVVVLSHRLWQTQFGADRSIVGRTVLLDGTRHTVVGVAPASFNLPSDVDIWRPGTVRKDWTIRGNRLYKGPVALIKRGTSFDQARQKARLVAAQLRAAYPTDEAGLDFDIEPLRDYLVGNSARLIVVLFGAVAALLLIACANVATLLLVRATSRSTEIGIRLALGAGARRVASQLLVESLLLSAVGAGLGVMLAELVVGAVVRGQGAALPLLTNVGIDWRVLAFAVAVTVGAGLTFGLAPALHSARTDVVSALKSGSRRASAHRGASSARSMLVALELALVVPLLVSAALLAQSFTRLVRVDPGFRADHIVRFDIALPKCGTVWAPDTTCVGVEGPRYMTDASVEAFSRELDARLRALPGIEQVAITFGAPFTDWAKQGSMITVDGVAPPPVGVTNPVEMKATTPGYFAMLGVPILQGRDFSAGDREGARRVLIVSEGAVKAYFGGQAPIGKHLREGPLDIGEVIGVVADTKTQGLNTRPEPAVYQAYWQSPVYYLTALVQSRTDLGPVMAAARTQVAAIDPTLPLFHLMPFGDAVEASAAPAKLAANVVTGFAASALLLAMIGIYGIVSYTVRERHRELGIRLALGAPRGRLVRLVVRDGMMVATVGLAVGLVIAGASGRLLRGLLFGVTATDPASYAVVCVALGALVVCAAWIPARRAASVDPLVAMRPE
ncbi:MAG: ABC transporter permease [Gemmatimonadaceae bacterium]